jgi:hypothetical protein
MADLAHGTFRDKSGGQVSDKGTYRSARHNIW